MIGYDESELMDGDTSVLPMSGLPLGGIRVLDLSGPLGSYCARLLADAGADVVKAEPPEGDPLRRRPPFAGDRADPEGSLSFAYYHANKRGVVLDYRRPEAAGVLADLGARCDVVVLTPTAREPVAGFDPMTGELAWAGPDTVVCSITPFGLTGPYRNWRATHLVSHAMSGLMYTQGPLEGPPVVVPGQQLYDQVGTHAAIAVLTALRARPRAGGQLIDMSAHEVLTQSCFAIYDYTNAARIGRRRPQTIQYSGGGTWECRDGVIEFTASTDKHWYALMELLGHPAELSDPSWAHPNVRHPYEEKIIEVMRPLIAAMSREDFFVRGQQLGLPCTLVNTVGQFADDQQPRSRGFFVRRPLGGLGEFELPGEPFRCTERVLAQYRRPAPRLGEDAAAEVAREWRSPAAGAPLPGAPLPGAPLPGAPLPGEGAPGPLSGIRVISFGTAIAGALSGTALADLGADVVKIESPSRPDNLRRLHAPGDPHVREPSGADTSPMFANFNRTTRSLALDMKDPSSVALFLRLAAAADVIVENYAPGVMRRWGLDYEQIAAANPRIIHLSLTGFGHSGPRSHYLAYGSTVCSFVGLTDAWPYQNGVHFDYISEAHGVFAVLAALAARDRTGRGTRVDLSEVETAAAVMGPMMLDYMVNGRGSVRPGNQVPGALLSEVVRCRGDDQWLAVELEEPADWRALAQLTGREDLAGAADAADEGGPNGPAWLPDEAARAALAGALAGWAAELTAQQAMRMLQRAGLAAGAVQDSEDVVRDPQHRERHFLLEMNHPDLGVAEYAAPPHRLAKTPPEVRRPAPRLGAHTIEVLGEWLGMAPAEAARYAWPK
jgi:crotonobetainyl-CoA:carnitine CoA-transferase CaiB-like acyl-CoA transferase